MIFRRRRTAGVEAPAGHQPHQPRRHLPPYLATVRGRLVVALALVLTGAFTVQASSTWRLGQAHHLADLALPALILVLEVGSITSASIYVATRRRGLRVRAGLVIGLATSVGAVGGVQAYGYLIGLPVAALLLLLVDLIGLYWDEAGAAATTDASGASTEHQAAEDASGDTSDALEDDPADEVERDEDPVDEDPVPVVALRGGEVIDPAVVRTARTVIRGAIADGRKVGRPALRRELAEAGHPVSDHAGKALLAELGPIRAVAEGVPA